MQDGQVTVDHSEVKLGELQSLAPWWELDIAQPRADTESSLDECPVRFIVYWSRSGIRRVRLVQICGHIIRQVDLHSQNIHGSATYRAQEGVAGGKAKIIVASKACTKFG